MSLTRATESSHLQSTCSTLLDILNRLILTWLYFTIWTSVCVFWWIVAKNLSWKVGRYLPLLVLAGGAQWYHLLAIIHSSTIAWLALAPFISTQSPSNWNILDFQSCAISCIWCFLQMTCMHFVFGFGNLLPPGTECCAVLNCTLCVCVWPGC